MQLKFWRFDLRLTHQWAISSNAFTGGIDVHPVVFLQLDGDNGRSGLGESAPCSRYDETADTVLAFLARVEAKRLSFDDIPASMDYLDTIAHGNYAAKNAVNLALWDGFTRRLGQPIYENSKLGFTENRHVTSFSIGIDRPDIIRSKVAAAADFPILKLKVGSPNDKQNLAATREVAPAITVRVHANEAWTTKEEALRNLE